MSRWYIIHAYSGFENKVRDSIMAEAHRMGLDALVEKEYRVVKDANHRAIIGYSMGGMQASTIGLNHPEVFAYVGAMSGNAREAALAKALADPEKTNKAFKLIWLGCGTDDSAITGGRALHKVLAEKGIRHEWVESPGYRHDYQIWRIYLRDLLPKLFRD